MLLLLLLFFFFFFCFEENSWSPHFVPDFLCCVCFFFSILLCVCMPKSTASLHSAASSRYKANADGSDSPLPEPSPHSTSPARKAVSRRPPPPSHQRLSSSERGGEGRKAARRSSGEPSQPRKEAVETPMVLSQADTAAPNSRATPSNTSADGEQDEASTANSVKEPSCEEVDAAKIDDDDDGNDEGACAETETQSSSTRPNLSGFPTYSTLSSSAAVLGTEAAGTGGAAATAPTSFSSNSTRVVAMPRSVSPRARPVLSATLIALPRESYSSSSPPPPPQPPQPSSTQREGIERRTAATTATDGASGDDAGEKAAMMRAPRSTRRGPASLSSISPYTTVPVLPPQVFRSASSGGAVVVAGSGGGNSAASTPVLSPPQQPWFSAAVQRSPPTHASAVSPLHAVHSAGGATTPHSSMTGPVVAGACAASSPTHLPARVLYSLGGSRKRNSVSVPTNTNLGSEDEDYVNTCVVDDGYQSTDQWLMLSQSTSNMGNNTMMSTAMTSRSSSRDHGTAEESGVTPATTTTTTMTMMRGTNSGSVSNYQPPSNWSFAKPQTATERGLVHSVASAPNNATSPASSHKSSQFNRLNSGSVPDPPQGTSCMPTHATTATTTATDTANTPTGGCGYHASRGASFALSLRSPLQSPPTTTMQGGRSGGGGGTLLSRRGSLGSLQLSTHDPYNAAVISPMVGPRTGSLSNLHSPSAVLTAATTNATAATGHHSQSSYSDPKTNAAMTTTTTIQSSGSATAAMSFDATSVRSNPPYPSRGVQDAMALSQSDNNNAAVMSDQFLFSRRSPSFAGSSVTPPSARAMMEPPPPPSSQPPLHDPQQQQQQFLQQYECTAPQLTSSLSRSGHPDFISPFSYSPQTSTTLTSPTQTSVLSPQQQQQQHASYFPITPTHPPPRRRNAQEALTGFFSEGPIELGDQTHLTSDRNGVPYQGGGALPCAHAGPSGNNSGGGAGMPPPPPPPSSLPPSSAYDGVPAAQNPYYYDVDPTLRGSAPPDTYAPYRPSMEPQQQQQHMAAALGISGNPVTSMLYHRPPAFRSTMDPATASPIPPYTEGGDCMQLRGTHNYSYSGDGSFQHVSGVSANPPPLPPPPPPPFQPPQLPPHSTATSMPPSTHCTRCARATANDLYGCTMNCTEMDSQACATAYGSAGGVGVSQLYPLDSTMYPTAPAAGSGSSTGPSYPYNNNYSNVSATQIAAMPSQNVYDYGSRSPMPVVHSEIDARRHLGGDLPTSAFTNLLPRSAATTTVPVNISAHHHYQSSSSVSNNSSGSRGGRPLSAGTGPAGQVFSHSFQQQMAPHPNPMAQSYPNFPSAATNVISTTASHGPSVPVWDAKSRDSGIGCQRTLSRLPGSGSSMFQRSGRR